LKILVLKYYPTWSTLRKFDDDDNNIYNNGNNRLYLYSLRVKRTIIIIIVVIIIVFVINIVVRGARQLSAIAGITVVRRSAWISSQTHHQPANACRHHLPLISIPFHSLHHPSLLQLRATLHTTSVHQVSMPRLVILKLRLCVFIVCIIFCI